MNFLNYKNRIALLSALFVITVGWWLFLNSNGAPQATDGYAFNLFYAFIPLIGGVFALSTAQRWGLRGHIGKGFLFLGLGLLAWALGGFAWAYYNFTGAQEVPYPSLADVGFLGSTWLFMAGLIYLVRVGWSAFKTDPLGRKIVFAIIPLGAALFNFFFLFVKQVCENDVCETTLLFFNTVEDPLERALNIIYPMNDLVLLSLAAFVLTYSYKLIGGKLTKAFVGMCVSMIVLYIADIIFTMGTSNETYYNGDVSDLMYATSFFILSISIALFHIKPSDLYANEAATAKNHTPGR